MIYFVKISKLN